jgi:hypothetical protein
MEEENIDVEIVELDNVNMVDRRVVVKNVEKDIVNMVNKNTIVTVAILIIVSII